LVTGSELEQQIHASVDRLPEQCRLVFQLSRFEGKKYQEIADELNISVKTVENQVSKALKYLREDLKEFLPLLLFYLPLILN
jgi:RNA polymerase sigma-70 factor (ECF subfamily)